ncbi:uncharacterized protein LOC128883058 [Hylaeus volcanicus]|uniref:uncharacterized protein LOC128883058 n=1 Tax=Hylaeus volcanicus TaxID=313075 RepID=UPI0023B7A06F|nr:uncharacterized protein LOC128883058 [Hylaeus volcanicus]
MESLSSKLTQELDHYILLKEKYNQAQVTIAEILFSQKRVEAELEELEDLEDDVKVYKQISRMFSQRSVGSLREFLKAELCELDEQLPKLRELETSFQTRLKNSQTTCVELENKIKTFSASKSSDL